MRPRATPRRSGRRWRGSGRSRSASSAAGFTGLSAGLELAERGHEVLVLEGARVGWGASGRNGGQIVNGLNAGLETIGRRYGQRRRPDFVAHGGAGGRADHPRAGGAATGSPAT